MARLGKKNDGKRDGMLKKRAQVFNGRSKRFTKVDTETGKFIDQMSRKWKPFRGVKKK